MRAGRGDGGDQPVWADGPHAEAKDVAEDSTEAEITADPLSGSLGDRLMVARESAAAVRAADTRSRSALYRALGRAHDFALATVDDADAYQTLLDEAGIAVQARAPMTPVVKLVFGVDYDKTRLAEYAGVLAHARRHGVGAGALHRFLDGFDGGVKAVVAAERAARRPAPAADPRAVMLAAMRDAPALATLAIDGEHGEFTVLVGRARPDGRLDVIARVDTAAVVDAALRRAAAPAG